jgi:hypothetical protein
VKVEALAICRLQACTMSEWVLLNNTVVRVEDVRRIDMVSVSGSTYFNIIFRHGDPLRLYMAQKGSDWCMKIMEAGKKTLSGTT